MNGQTQTPSEMAGLMGTGTGQAVLQKEGVVATESHERSLHHSTRVGLKHYSTVGLAVGINVMYSRCRGGGRGGGVASFGWTW